ncbi:SEC-C metal-binding domain-containing protein [Mesorhizobium sp. M0142]
MKTGRNEPCPCGSGKKFKKCCLNAAKQGVRSGLMPERDPVFLAQAQAMMRQHQAAESVRQQQQGYGNPIVSWVDEANGFRFVAAKTTVHWGRNWVIFPNFLDYFMKKTLGHEWGERERSKGRHPLFRWLQKTQAYSSHKPGDRKVTTIEMMGFIACWLHLAYLTSSTDDIDRSFADARGVSSPPATIRCAKPAL